MFEFLKTLSVPKIIRSAVTQAEGLWFDVTRQVQTSGYASLERLTLLGGARQSGFDYLPTRPGAARQVLALLPIRNHAEYTFVDLGSGKGRMLLIAAEYPFRKIQGLEFAVQLHEQAERNISCYRHSRRRCTNIASINADASEYLFPDGKLVVYLFNPFGAEVLEKVLLNLGESIMRQPRHVIVVMVSPELASVIESVPFLRLYAQTPRFRIYQTVDA